MNTLLFVFLQGFPDDPADWGNPDALPINEDLPILLIAGLALGIVSILRSRHKKEKAKRA